MDDRPDWRGAPRHQELFFLALDGTLMSARISTAKVFAVGVPKTLFPTGNIFTGANVSGNRHQYAVANDGKTFHVLVLEQRASPSITVVVNWLAARQK